MIWPDGSDRPKVLWLCPKCSRNRLKLSDTEPQFHCSGPTYGEGHDAAEMVEVPVLPTSVARELAGALKKLKAAVEPYVERAAPHERMNDEWCQIYDRLGEARYAADQALARFNTLTGGESE